jgi:hypothetical protein
VEDFAMEFAMEFAVEFAVEFIVDFYSGLLQAMIIRNGHRQFFQLYVLLAMKPPVQPGTMASQAPHFCLPIPRYQTY